MVYEMEPSSCTVGVAKQILKPPLESQSSRGAQDFLNWQSSLSVCTKIPEIYIKHQTKLSVLRQLWQTGINRNQIWVSFCWADENRFLTGWWLWQLIRIKEPVDPVHHLNRGLSHTDWNSCLPPKWQSQQLLCETIVAISIRRCLIYQSIIKGNYWQVKLCFSCFSIV